MSKSIVVIGGGISGLSAAFYLHKHYKDMGIEAVIHLIEAEDAVGGKIRTLQRNGFIIEKGPDSFLARKMPIIELTKELGLEHELTGINPAARKTYILYQNKLHRLPPGLMLGIPTQLLPFLRTGLISFAGKIRAAMDLFLPRRTEDHDQSLGQFLERRLGKEVVERIADPLLAGIYAGDTYDLSIQSTFPQFVEIERKHRSLILGMLAAKKHNKVSDPLRDELKDKVSDPLRDGLKDKVSDPLRDELKDKVSDPLRDGLKDKVSDPLRDGLKDKVSNPLRDELKDSLFLSYRRGLGSLVETLVNSMGGVQIFTGQRVFSIEKLNKPEVNRKYQVNFGRTGENVKSLEADAIILAIPAFAAAKLLSPHTAVDKLTNIPYVSVANVIMAFEAKDVKYSLEGSGFVVPRQERRFITACTWVSSKWEHTAPEGKVLLRCYVGRSGDGQWMALSDGELLAKVSQDLEEIMGITAKPLFFEVTRWKESMPQYAIGHLDNISQVRKQLALEMPDVYLTGSGYHGVGIPDCIRQGKEVAFQIINT